jgi:hypothetical protein
MSKVDKTTTETRENKVSFQKIEYVDMLINIEKDQFLLLELKV